MGIPGISHHSALVIYAELSGIDRFDRAKEVVRYVGLNWVIRESGDSRFEGSISKKGVREGAVNSYRSTAIDSEIKLNKETVLPTTVIQAVHSVVHTVDDEYLSRFYHRIERRKNKFKPTVATARKLLVSIYHMLDRNEVYDPPGVRS